jgi:hypothetical protein
VWLANYYAVLFKADNFFETAFGATFSFADDYILGNVNEASS